MSMAPGVFTMGAGDWVTVQALLNPGPSHTAIRLFAQKFGLPALARELSAKAAEPLSTAAVPHPLQKE